MTLLLVRERQKTDRLAHTTGTAVKSTGKTPVKLLETRLEELGLNYRKSICPVKSDCSFCTSRKQNKSLISEEIVLVNNAWIRKTAAAARSSIINCHGEICSVQPPPPAHFLPTCLHPNQPGDDACVTFTHL